MFREEPGGFGTLDEKPQGLTTHSILDVLTTQCHVLVLSQMLVLVLHQIALFCALYFFVT